MTQPDGLIPPGSANYPSLATFANKTQADWEAENRAAMTARFGDALAGIILILEKLPIIGDIIEIITGVEDGDLNDLGTWVNNLNRDLGKALEGLGKLVASVGGKIIEDVGYVITGAAAMVVDVATNIFTGVFGAVESAINGFAEGVGAAIQWVTNLLTNTSNNADRAISNNAATNIAIVNGWFGGGANGEVAPVQATVEAIKTRIERGYTLQSLTYNAGTSGAGTWQRPWGSDEVPPQEFYVVAFGSGGGGGAGGKSINAASTGGSGGSPGGYAAIQIDAATLPETVSYQVASGGLGRTGGTTSASSGANSSFGSYLTTVSGQYNVIDILGYYSSNSSAPGAGGAGASINTTDGFGNNGATGGSSPLAAGGTGGTGSGFAGSGISPTPGGAGKDASLTGTARAGGGGGGGGGAAANEITYDGSNNANGIISTKNGQLGGNGGFPGGGAGGGGSCRILDVFNNGSAYYGSVNAGNGGNGAHGVIILLWK